MKRACVEKLKVDAEKIEVMPPKINIEVKKYFEPSEESFSTFFYPASGIDFKNHKAIVDACLKLQEAGIENFRVIFTLKGDENGNVRQLDKKVKDHGLPIEFIGSISRQEVFDCYSKSVLVFPSYIETVGLPLFEAKRHRAPIIASDCAFSHEVLEGYDIVRFFNPFDSGELKEEMSNAIKGGLKKNFSEGGYDEKNCVYSRRLLSELFSGRCMYKQCS